MKCGAGGTPHPGVLEGWTMQVKCMAQTSRLSHQQYTPRLLPLPPCGNSQVQAKAEIRCSPTHRAAAHPSQSMCPCEACPVLFCSPIRLQTLDGEGRLTYSTRVRSPKAQRGNSQPTLGCRASGQGICFSSQRETPHLLAERCPVQVGPQSAAIG